MNLLFIKEKIAYKKRLTTIFTLKALKGYYASFASHQGVLASLWGGQVKNSKAFKTIKKPKSGSACAHADELRNTRKVAFRPNESRTEDFLFIHFLFLTGRRHIFDLFKGKKSILRREMLLINYPVSLKQTR